jgi:membrane protease YdiL (CAAX protease family)
VGVLIGVVVVVVAVAQFLAFQASRAGTTSFWLLAVGPTIALAVVGVLRMRRDGVLFEWMRPRWGDATVGVAAAAALMALTWAFVRFVAPRGSVREGWLAHVYLQVGDPDVLRAHVPLVAVVIIAAACAEEIVWRGLVTQLVAERIGSRRAWLASTFLYAIAMVPTAWALSDARAGLNPLLPLAALGAGAVWGLLARFYGRLVPAMISHALFDWCVVMLFRMWGTSI